MRLYFIVFYKLWPWNMHSFVCMKCFTIKANITDCCFFPLTSIKLETRTRNQVEYDGKLVHSLHLVGAFHTKGEKGWPNMNSAEVVPCCPASVTVGAGRSQWPESHEFHHCWHVTQGIKAIPVVISQPSLGWGENSSNTKTPISSNKYKKQPSL